MAIKFKGRQFHFNYGGMTLQKLHHAQLQYATKYCTNFHSKTVLEGYDTKLLKYDTCLEKWLSSRADNS